MGEKAPIQFLTMAQVCRYLQCSRQTVYRLIDAGKIQATKVNSSLRIYPDSLDTYLAKQKVQPGELG